MLSGSPQGATETLLSAYGFKWEVLTSLEQNGLVTVAINTVRAHNHMISVRRVRITDAGRQAIIGNALRRS